MSGKIIIIKRRKRKAPRGVNGFLALILAVFLMLIIVFATVYNNSFKPIIRQVAQYQAEQLSTLAISEGVIKVIDSTKVSYEDIVDISRTPDGKLTTLSVNLYKINRLKSEIILLINDIINSKEKIRIFIPLGNITGIELFSGLGPMVPFELVPTGNTFADFDNKFTATGINQTKHTVSLKITSKVSMLMPDNLSVSSEFTSYIPIAESIIAGDIPQNYTVLETSPEQIREDILNLR